MTTFRSISVNSICYRRNLTAYWNLESDMDRPVPWVHVKATYWFRSWLICFKIVPFALDAKETPPDKSKPANTLSLSAHLDNELLKRWNQNTMTKDWLNRMFISHFSLGGGQQKNQVENKITQKLLWKQDMEPGNDWLSCYAGMLDSQINNRWLLHAANGCTALTRLWNTVFGALQELIYSHYWCCHSSKTMCNRRGLVLYSLCLGSDPEETHVELRLWGNCDNRGWNRTSPVG